MIWIILGVIVGLVVLGVAGICIRHTIIESRKEQIVRANGRPILATLMMANQTAFDPNGDPEFPGVVVFGYYETSPQLAVRLRDIAQKLYELYSADPQQLFSLPPSLQHVAMTLKNHNYKDNRRNRVPPEIAGNMMVHFGDLWIRRERLPENWQANRQLACMATGDIDGQIILLPSDDPAARQIYLSTDPAQAAAGSSEQIVPQAGAPQTVAELPQHSQTGQINSAHVATSKTVNKPVLLAALVGVGALILVIGVVLVATLFVKDEPAPRARRDDQQVSARAPNFERTSQRDSERKKVNAERVEPQPVNPQELSSDRKESEDKRAASGQGTVADARFHPIDLQHAANASQTQSTGITPGVHHWADVDFQVGPKLLQLGSSVFKEYPPAIRKIDLNNTPKKLHFLQATMGGAYQQPGHSKHEQDGTLVGRYEVHYQNGATESIPLVYGRHLRGWWNWDKGRPVTDAKLAWTGEHAQAKRYNLDIRLYHMSWVNPRPNEAIAFIDFVSVGAKAAPFCVAITVETAD